MKRSSQLLKMPSGLQYRFHFYEDGSVIVEAKSTLDRRFSELADLPSEVVSVIVGRNLTGAA